MGIFLGYGEGHRSYRILDAETGNVKITHHVKFNHHVFPSYPSDGPNPDASLLIFLFDDEDPPSQTPANNRIAESAEPTSPNSDSSGDDQRFEELLQGDLLAEQAKQSATPLAKQGDLLAKQAEQSGELIPPSLAQADDPS
ncbi:hypothetical protein PCANC_25834 [Puccinia coronata f. sp. avenae]|uniref:Retroviral polymerase SH3-like domain-containing protein n=1 Tax=Puccinia coronata f. sp. avenae TaxID=200324 RepID=A0A2N5TUL0_9BASI|nr:hypothetical protein PCANC_25834 [Puccinia coronata f. sp. avenae]